MTTQVVLNETVLFPGATPDKTYDLATPGQLLKKVCRKAGITGLAVARAALARNRRRPLRGFGSVKEIRFLIIQDFSVS